MAAEGLDPVPAPGGQQATTPSSNAVLAAATRVKGAATALLAQAKPWSELADRSAFSKPSDLSEVGRDWGARDKGTRRLNLRHRFFGGAPRRFLFFFEKKEERAASLFAWPHSLAPLIRRPPRSGKQVRDVPLPPRPQTCSNRALGGGARGDIFDELRKNSGAPSRRASAEREAWGVKKFKGR